MATYIGTGDDDTYPGTTADDTISGGGGNDTLSGDLGNDKIQGESGADTLYGGDDNDYLASNTSTFAVYGGISTDTGTEKDVLDGGTGDDYLAAGAGDDVEGGDGVDHLLLNLAGASAGVTLDLHDLGSGPLVVSGGTISGVEVADAVSGTNYDDNISYSGDGGSFYRLYGNGGNDHLTGGYYSGSLYGGDGSDTLDVTAAGYAPSLYGGNGNDTLLGATYQGTGPANFDAGDGNDTVNGSGYIYGGAGNDTLHSRFSYYASVVYGGTGDDTIDDDVNLRDGDSAKTYYGDAGADTITSGGYNDFLYSDSTANGGFDLGAEHDTLVAGGGNDFLSAGFGDDADGGDGTDKITLSWAGSTEPVALDTADITVGPFDLGGGTIQNVEVISGLYMSDGDDVVHVSPQYGTIVVHGGAGHDQLSGGQSAVHLYGDAGNDMLIAAAGGDTLEGGADDDTYSINMVGEDVIEATNAGFDTVKSSIDYTLTANVEVLKLLTHHDLDGTGNGSDNTVNGNKGDNALSGLGGNDILVGGKGIDTLTGGSEADKFRFNDVGDLGTDEATTDHITDFSHAEHDRIALSGMDAVVGAGNQKFDFIGTDAFDGQAGELRYEISGGNTLVTGDVNGDLTADFMIVLDGNFTLVAHDFTL